MARIDVGIIGAGISGLATAFYLKKRGINSLVLERSAHPGGLIQTNRAQGCQLEAGPDSFIAAKPAVAKLAEDLQIEDQIIGSNDERRQVFVVRKGTLVPMPKGMVMMVPTDWDATLRSPLFSDRTKGRFLLETFAQPRERSGDFSIHDFVADHFSEEALTYITEPLLSGVYGGDTAQLSAKSVLPRFVEHERKFGSLIKAAQQERAKVEQKQSFFLSFCGGMQTLIDKLVEKLDREQIRFRFSVEQVSRGKDCWKIRSQAEMIEASNVVLACPAHVSSCLLSELDATLAGELSAIPYSSALLVTLLYKRTSIAHPLNGFGFLVPRPERTTIAAATWINTKFPSRISPELIAIRAFIVHPEVGPLLKTSDDDLIAVVRADLQKFMGIVSAPVHSSVHPWPQSMPQYIVGHSERLQRILLAVQKLPHLHLVSNYLDGVGIPDCVRLAEQTALSL